MNKGKKLIVFIAMAFVLSAVGFAAWTLNVKSNEITANVVSDPHGAVYFSEFFDDIGDINTTISAIEFNRTAEIRNDNGIIMFKIKINNSFIDYENDSCDFTGDLTLKYYLNGQEVFDGDNFTMLSGIHNLTTNWQLVRSSCPADYSTMIEFMEII